MGLIDKIKWAYRKRKLKALGVNFDGFFDSFVAQASSSGINVTWETALQCSVAFSCARVISEGLAQIPFRLYRKDGRDRMPATDHYKFPLFDSSPNEYNTSFEFFETMGLHLAFCNNFFAYKNFRRGQLDAILPWNPKDVTVRDDGGVVTYHFRLASGKLQEIPRNNVWHIKGPSWNSVIGLDAVKLARDAIGLGMATEKHGSKLFSNGATVGGILSTEQDLPQEKRQELRKSWDARQAGNDNAWKTAVLWAGLKWAPQGFPNDQSQFLETRQYQVEEICRFFRVMPIMIGYSDKASTYASAEQMFLAHVVHTMGPWYRRIEKSADMFLLTPQERNGGFYTKFSPQALLRSSHAERAGFYTQLYNIGAINPNEIRELEDMNPYDGGDEYRVPLNMAAPGEEGESPDENEK